MSLITNLHVKCPEEGAASLPKISVPEVEVYFGGCRGDFNSFRFNKFKGEKANRALLLMSLDVLANLDEEGWPVRPGDLGENLSIDGVLYSSFKEGQKYRAGSVLFELTEQANPCKKLAQLRYVGDDRLADFIKTMMGRRGWYAKVIGPGLIKKGDELILL